MVKRNEENNENIVDDFPSGQPDLSDQRPAADSVLLNMDRTLNKQAMLVERFRCEPEMEAWPVVVINKMKE